jgi:hypothetical protein
MAYFGAGTAVRRPDRARAAALKPPAKPRPPPQRRASTSTSSSRSGLPEALPADEKLLWQGSPDWRVAGARRLPRAQAGGLLRAPGGCAVAFVWCRRRFGLGAAQAHLGLLAAGRHRLGLVALMAWLSARTTVYTLTDRRVVMRIGIVLTLTFNLPLRASKRPTCT